MMDIAKELIDMTGMKTHELRDRWRHNCRVEPPPKISRDLLIRAVAYQIQEKVSYIQSYPQEPLITPSPL